MGEGAPDPDAETALLIGHTHWDHIHGVPFFSPLFAPGRWAVYGPRGLGQSLADTLAGQMQYTYFPVTIDDMSADIEYHDLVEGTFEIGDVRIRTQYLNHPALTLGYRIEADGQTFVYAADHEPFDPALAAGGDPASSESDARHVEFLSGADVVVHDAQYLASEYEARQGWGHSTMEYVVDMAVAAGVEHLVLTHHDPSRSDDAIDALVADARARAAAAGHVGTVDAAYEGMVIDRPARDRAAKPGDGDRRALRQDAILDAPGDVVVAIADPSTRSLVEAAVEAEQLTLRSDPDKDDSWGENTLVIVDANEDEDVLDAVLAHCGPDTAIVGVTTRLPAPALAVLDWIVWPASLAHVRTKVRSALLRRACRWVAAPLPSDEERRLESLRSLDVLDSAPEERFDRFTAEARDRLDVPIALVSLVDADRQWFKSADGIDATETPRDQAVCAHAILGDEVFHVPDLLADPRFADNPVVGGAPRLRSYAGVPLELSDGSRVGTFCVLDHRPRDFDDEQLAELQRLAAGVLAELESPG